MNTFIELERENTNLEGKLTSSGIPARHAFSQDIRNEKRKDMMAGVDVEGNKAPPEISEFFTPLNQQFLAMLIEMEEKDLAEWPHSRKMYSPWATTSKVIVGTIGQRASNG